MSKRPRAVPPQPATRDVSDKSKLQWAQFNGPLVAAANSLGQAVSQAQNQMAELLMRADGYDPAEWQFHMDTLKYIKRSGPPPA